MTTNEVAMSRRHIGGESPMVVSSMNSDTLYVGLFGSIDSNRMATLTDKLTQTADSTDSCVVILDLSNVDAIDSSVAAQLYKLADTVKLLGVQSIFCGIRSAIARTMVSTGVRMEGYTVVRDLRMALEKSYELLGIELVKRS